MSNPITDIQTRYLSALLQNIDQDKYEELKKRLKIPIDAPISELTKDDAYRLITKMITESTPQEVEEALSTALGRDITRRRSKPKPAPEKQKEQSL